ncbi:unnamed protein product [Triticum turgidum subsp. durum]|uniref:FAD-binding PCMH-type domain-containing protein n=1 Tax=Triticum turgidum subsp. durum TaxID=4567 RepID=A0A9R1PDA1_TRITD|nr:unnamed protein product [Triticum turgidum subsp. durum]
MALVLTICFLGFFVPAPSLALSSNNNDFLRCLSANIPSQLVLTPSSPSFTPLLVSSIRNARLVAPATASPPLCIVTPTNTSHVQTAVRCGRRHSVRVRVRSGGHDNEGLSYRSTTPNGQAFAVIDLAKLHAVHVNPHEATAWVETGATVGQLYYRIAKAAPGLGFPASVCPTVGVGGIISGGGIGLMMRKYGLSADNVLDASMVDANGNLLANKKAMGDDLFWAIRGGGGGNFGIVLSWKLRLVAVPPKVTFFKVAKTMEQGAVDTNRSTTLGPFVKNKSDYVKKALTKETWKKIFLWPNGAASGQLILEPHGGIMGRIGAVKIPFPHRSNVLYNIQYVELWNGKEVGGNATPNWIGSLYNFMTPYVSKNPRGAYVNYRDLDIGTNQVVDGMTSYGSAKVWGESYFGPENFRRLAEIKRKVDAGDYFQSEQSVPPFPLKE